MKSSKKMNKRGKTSSIGSTDNDGTVVSIRSRPAKLGMVSHEANSRSDAINSIPQLNQIIETRQPSTSTRQPRIPLENFSNDSDDSTLSSSDDGDIILNTDLYQINAMIDKLQKFNTENDSDDSTLSSSDDDNFAIDTNLSQINDMIDKVQNLNTETSNKLRDMKQNRANIDSIENARKENNIELINTVIDKLQINHTKKAGDQVDQSIQPITLGLSSDDLSVGEDYVPSPPQADQVDGTIQSVSSDISMSDSSVGVAYVPSTTQANLKFYIDSLHTSTALPNVNALQDSPATLVEKLLQQNHERVQKMVAYDNDKLESYIQKAQEVMNKTSPKVSEVEYIIIYARRDGIPIVPILQTFLNYKNFGNNEGERSLERQVIQRFILYICEAIAIIENNMVSPQYVTDLTARASKENIDDSLLRQILSKPENHVKLQEDDCVEDENDESNVEILLSEMMSKTENHVTIQDKGSNDHVVYIAEDKTSSNDSSKSENDIKCIPSHEVCPNNQTMTRIDQSQSFTESIVDQTQAEARNDSEENEKNEENDMEHSEGIKARSEDVLKDSIDLDLSTSKQGKSWDDVNGESKFSTQLDLYTHSVDELEGFFADDDSTTVEDDDNHIDNETPEDIPKSSSNESKENVDNQANNSRSYKDDPSQEYYIQKVKQLSKAKSLSTIIVGSSSEIDMVENESNSLHTNTRPLLNPVEATKTMRSRRMLKCFPSIMPDYILHQCKLTPKQRVSGHPKDGGINVESIKGATKVTYITESSYNVDWEDRDISQFFLQDADITRCNWFGEIQPVEISPKNSDPVAQPQSVIMNLVGHPRKWDLEWYTTWYTRKHNPKKESKRRPNNEDECKAPEIPEVGNILTTRFRGEKGTLVHLDYISWLSKSRWKSQFF